MAYKVLVHDYAGHPFQAELSRELARRGNTVIHAWFGQDQGPKGRMSRLSSDPTTLSFQPVVTGLGYSKSNFIKRRTGDLAYGDAVAALVEDARPDIVISGNMPTEAQEKLLARCRTLDVPFIYWCQDFYSIAASRILEKRMPGIGHVVAAYYRFLEKRQMQRSAHIVHITDAFCAQTDKWGIDREETTVIPNWGAIDELPQCPRDNEWARAQNLPDGPRFLYSGTLGLKHNPELIANLARAIDDDGTVVLVSTGTGTERLKTRAAELPALTILPLQPFEVFAQVLGSADVLLAVIERDAGTFSVPSKILSYLCAGRPVILAAPRDNLAAKIITETGAGAVVEPENSQGFVDAALAFSQDPECAAAAARAARRYAEENFVLSRVTDRFDAVFSSVLEPRS